MDISGTQNGRLIMAIIMVNLVDKVAVRPWKKQTGRGGGDSLVLGNILYRILDKNFKNVK